MLDRILVVVFILLVIWGFTSGMETTQSLPTPTYTTTPIPAQVAGSIPRNPVPTVQVPSALAQAPQGLQDAGNMLDAAGRFFASFARLQKQILAQAVDGAPEPLQTLIGFLLFVAGILVLIGLQTVLTFVRMVSRLGG